MVYDFTWSFTIYVYSMFNTESQAVYYNQLLVIC